MINEKILELNNQEFAWLSTKTSLTTRFPPPEPVPEKIAATLTQLLQNDEARRAQTVRFRALHEELRCNASVQAAQAIGELLAENDRSLRE